LKPSLKEMRSQLEEMTNEELKREVGNFILDNGRKNKIKKKIRIT
jgi:hypothetical protein